MTYQEFLEKYRRYRNTDTPDIRDRLPRADYSTEPVVSSRRPFGRRRVLAMVSAVAVLLVAVAACVLLWPGIQTPPIDVSGWESIPSPGSGPESSAQQEPVMVVDQIPAWYAPGELLVNPVTYSDPKLDEADGFNGFVSAHFLDLTGRYNTRPGHESCTGVYYDITTQDIVCVTHAIWEALARNGQGDEQTEVYVKFYEPNLGKVVFTLPKAKGRPTYCLDMAAGTYTQLPVSLYHSAGHMGGPGQQLSGKPYFVMMELRPSGNLDDVLLINLDTCQVTNILKNDAGQYERDAMDDAWLSPGGNYVYYTEITDPNDSETVNSPARTTVIYDIRTGESRTFQGEILYALPDDSRLVVRAPEGLRVVDCATAESVPWEKASDVPAQYRYSIVITDRYTDDCRRLARRDLLTGEESAVSDAYIYGYTVSADNRYLYYYIRGEAFIICQDIVTGEQFGMSVDPAFLAATEEGENGSLQLFFDMSLDEASHTLFMGYIRTDGPRQDPVKVEEAWKNDPSNQLHELSQAGKFTSILSIGELIRKYPQGLAAYEGDGFLYLLYTGLELHGRNSNSMMLMVEDYRTNTVYNVHYANVRYKMPDDTTGMDEDIIDEMINGVSEFYEYHVSSDFNIYHIRPLPAGGEQATRELLEQAGIPIKPALMDYSVYIRDGEADMEAMIRYFMKPERVLGITDSFYMTKPGVGGPYNNIYSPDLGRLLEYLYDQEYRYMPADWQKYYQTIQYKMEFYTSSGDVREIIFGVRNGKPYATWYGCVIDISPEAYSQLKPWLEEKYQASLYIE